MRAASLHSLFLAVTLANAAAVTTIGPSADLNIVNGIVSPDGFTRDAVLAGGTLPGPVITATKGQTLSLNVVNQLTNETMLTSTSVHWHGLFESNGNSWADGPAFVTQCPITSGDSFLYTIPTGQQTGTFWYHSHLGVQYGDGLRGAIVIYDPEDPFKALYDVDDESTIITLIDWYHAPVSTIPIPPVLDSTLINGLGRYAGGPNSPLAVISVTPGLRYRFRLISMAYDPNYVFSIDNHTMTIIEVEGVNHNQLTVDSIQIFAAQRYSFILKADQKIDNYWIRTVASDGNPVGAQGFANGINSAILRYVGAPIVEPTTPLVESTNPLIETNLHPLDVPGVPPPPPVPGLPFPGGADVNINLPIVLNSTDPNNLTFDINGVAFVPPTVPVLLQILSGAQTAAELLPSGSLYTLPPNKVIEISIPGGSVGAPHPFHLHGHTFHVIRSAGNSTYNFDNPVIRDVVSTGPDTTDNVTFRFTTDNTGPWFLHCHIDLHLSMGLAVVLAENPSGVTKDQPAAWDQLCPTYNDANH
ncbi:Laccase 1 [Mycena chlorophos]|uniref:Laccase 1 n=1 Tax=Mycena chlorophos TaxID=658473 RepID=A0A8H6TN37_MYCCL|nr:Laccase 1 [Mycena chlorophos]